MSPHQRAGAVELYDGPTAPEALLREVAALWLAEMEELSPEDPPWEWVEVEAFLRSDDDRFDRRRWVATSDEGGRVVGRLELRMPTTGVNGHLGLFELYVLPDARKQGHGTALLTAMLDVLDDAGRAHVRTAIVEGSPGDQWFAARGGTVGLHNRKSRLDVSTLDRSMLRTWVADGERLAGRAGYSLHFLDAASDEDLARYAAARAIMNTAPKGDLDTDPWVHTVDSVKAELAELRAAELFRWSLLAVHEPSGECVGFTDVTMTDASPEHAWQGGTAVRPDHRNHGLGRWLKGAMAERLLAERPALRFVDTENAFVNEPMLNINLAMGFELVKTVNEWQAPVAAIRTALEGRT